MVRIPNLRLPDELVGFAAEKIHFFLPPKKTVLISSGSARHALTVRVLLFITVIAVFFFQLFLDRFLKRGPIFLLFGCGESQIKEKER